MHCFYNLWPFAVLSQSGPMGFSIDVSICDQLQAKSGFVACGWDNSTLAVLIDMVLYAHIH